MTERDNSNRTGLPSDGEAVSIPKTPETPTKVANPMNFWNTSTEFVELPSGGSFYTSDNPASSGKLEIKDMTAFHEDILSNKGYILEGVMFDKFIEAISEASIDAKELLAGDRTAVMIAARSTAYGERFKADVKCPLCGTVNKLEPLLRQASDETPGNLVLHPGATSKELLELFGATLLPEKKIKFKLASGVEIVCRLTDGYLEKELYDLGNHKKKHKIGDGDLTSLDTMLAVITSINGIEDRAERSNILKNIPASEASYFRSVYKALSPRTEIQISETCAGEFCSNLIEQEVGLSPEFFWPKS